jgi:acyl dehydratase
MLRESHPRIRQFSELQPGEVIESAALTVTEAHITAFAGLTGDFHPLHMDAVAAAETPFKGRIAHGLLITSLCNGLINQADRFDAIAILSIEYDMVAPVLIGDTIHVRSELVDKRITSAGFRGIVVYAREVVRQNGDVVQRGRTTFLTPVDSDEIAGKA